MLETTLPGSGLVNRLRERDVLEQVVAGVRAGQRRVLVVRGEAGVGKTALLERLVADATGSIARAAGVESEMELAYAGLQQLCAPMLGGLPRLPDPQREAVSTAFGLGAGNPPDRFLVGLAVLGLLAEVADAKSLLCIIDDAQWVDRVSVQTLAFVARRLLAERVALVFSLRDDEHRALAGLPELVVEGLEDADARVAGVDHPGRARHSRPRPDLGRGAWEPSRAAGAAAGPTAGRRGGRVRAAGSRRIGRPHRGGLRRPVRATAGPDSATASRGGGRARG